MLIFNQSWKILLQSILLCCININSDQLPWLFNFKWIVTKIINLIYKLLADKLWKSGNYIIRYACFVGRDNLSAFSHAQPTSLTKWYAILHITGRVNRFPMEGESFDDIIQRMRYVSMKLGRSLTDQWYEGQACKLWWIRRPTVFNQYIDNDAGGGGICAGFNNCTFFQIVPIWMALFSSRKKMKIKRAIYMGIDQLQKGDVYVAKYVKVYLTRHTWWYLGTTIWTKTGTVQLSGTLRDLYGNLELIQMEFNDTISAAG